MKIEKTADAVAKTIIKKELPIIRLILYVNCILNGIYVITNFVGGVREQSLWFGLLGVYYLSLVIMQLAIITPILRHSFGENQLLEYRRYRLCGLILFALNILITILIALHIERDVQYDYSTLKLYLLAIYDIALFLIGLINLIRYRKYRSPLLSASRVIALTSAMIALLSLETAILNRNSASVADFRLRMIAITGAVICAIVLLMSLFMMIRGSVNIKKLRNSVEE